MKSAIKFALWGMAVVILGALAGWYFFLRSQTGATAVQDTARGFDTGSSAPFGETAGPAAENSSASRTSQPSQLWRIAPSPSAGMGFATTTTGLRVRYVERATGYVFDADPTSGKVSRVVGALTPKIYEAHVASRDRIVERSLDLGAVTTFAGRLGGATSTALSGTSLPAGIEAFSPDPTSDNIVYTTPEGRGVSVVVSAWDGTKQKRLVSLPIAGWRLLWLADGRIILAQKAADSLLGYAYVLKNGELRSLTAPALGLTVLPQSGSGALLFGSSSGLGITLYVRPSGDASAVRLPIATIPEKCVWSADPGIAYCAVSQSPLPAQFLNAWYRGEVHTSDAWWRVDARSGQAELVFTPSGSAQLDVINPTIDTGGQYIAFMNNVDLSPWLLRINK